MNRKMKSLSTAPGTFAKGVSGNPAGRPKGTKNTRTLQWEELGNEIANTNAGRFNTLLERLWDSTDLNDQVRAAELFLKMVEYFKPKLQRINTPDMNATQIPAPIIVIRPFKEDGVTQYGD